MDELLCPLCGGSSVLYHIFREREFRRCGNCLSVFTNPKDYLTPEAEKAHYECHENNPDDLRYQKFVSPVTDAILRDFGPQHKGLDFGSGTGSPIVKVLEDSRYDITQYDLFFHNNPNLLQQRYDYIACSETAEHFKEPFKEFELLRGLLLPDGKLYVMTDMLDDNRDFAAWYYKTDPTHVFLYHPKAFQWIKDAFGFRELRIAGRLIVLEV